MMRENDDARRQTTTYVGAEFIDENGGAPKAAKA